MEPIPVSEVAKILKISQVRVRVLLKQNKISGIKVGKFWMVDKNILKDIKRTRNTNRGRPRGS